jgi:hypothetical protein
LAKPCRTGNNGKMELEEFARTPAVLGKVGEKYVGVWASQVGISTNRVMEDEHGWDFLLELPRAHAVQGGVSLDLLPSDLKCFVQVKTVASDDGRSRIKLSNWQRMVTDPNPWFILIVIVDEMNEPSSAFLVHVDERLVSRVLKRLREIPEDMGDSLNKHYLDVEWDAGDRLDRLHGRALQSALKYHIGDNLKAYLSQKIAWADSAGFDDKPQHIKATFKASTSDEADEMLTDLLVGLRNEIAFSTIETTEVRFDIPKLVAKGREGTLSIDSRPPDAETRLIVRKSDLSEMVELQCETFASHPYFPDIDERFHKIRFVAPFFSAVLRRVSDSTPSDEETEPTVSLNLSWMFGPIPRDEDCLLADLSAAARVAIMLQRSANEPIELGLVLEDHSAWQKDFQARGALDPESFAFWSTIDAASRIAAHFRLSAKTRVDASSLLDQADAIRFLATTLERGNQTASFNASCNLEKPPDVDSAALVAVSSVRIGLGVVGRCIGFIGKPSWNKLSTNKLRIEVPTAQVRVMSEWQMPAADWSLAEESARIETTRQILERSGIQVVVTPDSAPYLA